MNLHLLGMAALAAALCAACAGLPPKSKPESLVQTAPLSEAPGGVGAWPAPEWWKQYRDPTLDQLVDLALESSPTLAAAHARFETARQSVRIASAESGAHLEANGDFSRQRLSDNGLFSPSLLGFNWYNQADLGLQASYTFDWWGKQREAVEAAMDAAHASQAERSAAALDARKLHRGRLLRMAGRRGSNRLGPRAREDARAGALDQRGTRPCRNRSRGMTCGMQTRPLPTCASRSTRSRARRKLRVIALAALAGRAPAELPVLRVRPLPSDCALALPDDVRIDLLSRRADIVASRWRVEAAEHSRESARAEFFPDISVNALIGFQSMDVGTLLSYGSRVPGASAAIHLPIFDAGRLKARYGAAQAAVASAAASYRDAVVSAAHDVATQASNLAQIEAQTSERRKSLDAATALRRAQRPAFGRVSSIREWSCAPTIR